MASSTCGICGHDQHQHLYRSIDDITGEEHQLVQCRGCGVAYVHPRPVIAELARYYPEAHQSAEPAAYEVMDARPRIKMVQELCPEPGRVLDVGCGKGLLLKGLREAGWDTTGIELSETSAAVARASGVKVWTEPLAQCALPAQSFDVITLFHSLEHMVDPMATLAHLRGLLKPGGLLIVEVPNHGSWYARAFGPDWFHLDAPRHLFHFSRHVLGRALARQGFQAERCQTHNLQYDTFGLIQSALNKLLGRKNLLNHYNTRVTTRAELRRRPGGWSDLLALRLSQAALYLFYLPLLLVEWALSPWVEGGTLRYVARSSALPAPARGAERDRS